MANEEKSRDAFEPRKRYAAVGMQQGRVMLDDDFNENERIRLDEERHVNLDVIGPAGSPDDGFLPANGTLANDAVDFEISAGTFYLGGLRLWNPETVKFQLQDDWLQQDVSDRPTVVDGRVDLVYIEAWQQPVTATEDTELFEVALGGPDTSTRLRTMWRVKLAAGIGGADCPAAWATLVKKWAGAGLGTIDETGERVVDAKLAVDYFKGEAGDLCTPAIQGGYLGAENQTIRVQIAEGNTFTWGFDNAAPAYQVDVAADLKTVKLATDPRDQAHWPIAGQIIEILPAGARLPNKEKLAELTGHLARVSKSFDPISHTIEINPPIPAGFGTAWTHRKDAKSLHGAGYFMRVWDRGDDQTSPLQIPVGSDIQLGSTGVKVTITGTQFVPGDHWIISARPKTPQTFVPWDLKDGRSVHGVHRFFAPLALIQWHGDGTFDVLHDCRPHFLPLTKVRGCCTYTVGDSITSFGRFNTIQAAVKALPADGGKVCVLAGTYPESVTIEGKTNVTIEGCGRRTIIAPDKNAPAFTIADSTYVTIRDLAIHSPGGTGISARDQSETPGGEISDLTLNDLEIEVRDRSAIDVRNVARVRIVDNKITAGELERELRAKIAPGRSAAIYASGETIAIEHNEIVSVASRLFSRSPYGGIQIGGGSEDVEIRRNRVFGGSGHSITLGSVVYAPQQLIDKVFELGWRRLIDKFVEVPAGHWIIITDQGCVGIDWVPDPPRGDGDTPLVPVSEGALRDVRIIDNELSGAAFSGISVARFFAEGTQQLITTDFLVIEDNWIHDNLTAANVEIPADMRDASAFGAIALADGQHIVVRENIIEHNGPSHVDPICGVFVLRATAISIENNRIVDNAPRTRDSSHAKAGFRGGIVLPSVQPPIEVTGKDLFRRRNGYPAVRIHDNFVSCALGRALLIIGEGQMSIEQNQLSSHGVVTPFEVIGLYNRIAETGFMPQVYEEAVLGRSTTSSRPARRYFEYAKGNTIGANRFDLSGAFNTNATSAVLGTTLLDALDSLGGVTVTVIDFGIAPDLARATKIRSRLDPTNYLFADTINAAARIARTSGKVGFADNHVTLDFTSTPETFVFSSVLLLSLDDIGMSDNQLEVLAATSPVFIEAIVVAMTARMNGNRINQEATVPSANRMSAIVFGLAAQATSNITTYCLGVYAQTTPWRVDANNIELIAQGYDKACAFADTRAQQYGNPIFHYLLTQ